MPGWPCFAFPAGTGILGLIGAGPVFGNNSLPRRIKLVVGLAVGIGLAGAFPVATSVPLDSWAGLLILFEQTLIGIAMGLAMRVVFAALDVMGELISLQMGLSFATFFDPWPAGRPPWWRIPDPSRHPHLPVPQWPPADAGHPGPQLRVAPDRQHQPAQGGWMVLVRSGSMIFAAGLLMALPVVTALLITNIALGILTRAAPQLNLFAIGFPITLTVGFRRPAARPRAPGAIAAALLRHGLRHDGQHLLRTLGPGTASG
jgi:flagellar biosynthetic protein FliR